MKIATRFEDGLPEAEGISLVVLNIYAISAQHMHAYLGEGANISTPDTAYESALELFENTRLGGSIIWINAEGVTLDELAQLEKQWLPIAGKAVMLMGSNQVPVINRSLQGLMAARRENPSFEAVVLTTPDSFAATTCRLMASQSGGWLRHEVKNAPQPLASIKRVLTQLGLDEQVSHRPSHTTESPAAQPRPAQQASAEIIELPLANSMREAQAIPPRTSDAGLNPEASPEATPSTAHFSEGNSQMTTLNDSMAACLQIDGAMAAALVDMGSGMALAKIGSGVNLDVAAAGNTEVLKSKLKTMASLGLKDTIEDMLITLGTQYHLIRPIPHKQGLFLYLVLDKTKGTLALARFKLMEIEKNITV
jgi:hypothetical protein